MLSFKDSFRYALKFIKEHLLLFTIVIFVISINLGIIGLMLNTTNIDIDLIHAKSLIINDNVNISIHPMTNNSDESNEIINNVINNINIIDGSKAFNLYNGNDIVFFDFNNYEEFYDFYAAAKNQTADTNLFIQMPKDFKYDYIGHQPVNNNEIMISNYLALYIMKMGIIDSNNLLLKPSSIGDLIGQEILLNNFKVKISGIYNLPLDFSLTDRLTISQKNYISNNTFSIYISNSFIDNDLTKKLRTYIVNDATIESIYHIFKGLEKVSITTPYTEKFESVSNFANIINKSSTIIKPISISLIVLIYLIFNNLYFKKEKYNIKILRTIGASKKDIFQIYFWQHLIVCLISYLLGIIILLSSNVLINIYLTNDLGFKIIFIENIFITYIKLAIIIIITSFIFLLYNIFKLSKNKIHKY